MGELARARRQPTARRARVGGPPAPERGLLALQRAAGNAAVVRALASRQTVQRRVGFELETAGWVPFIAADDKRSHRPAKRKEDTLFTGTNFELEADESGAGKPSIEFVTSPFDVSSAGLGSLWSTLGEIEAIMTRLARFAPKPLPAKLYSRELERSVFGQVEPEAWRTNFVLPQEHRLNANVLLSDGDDPQFKVQATFGVSLEDLPTLMRFFGRPQGETSGEQARRDPARRAVYEGRTQATGSDSETVVLLGDAPRLAQVALAHLQTGGAPALQASTGALVGFLAQVLLYVKALSSQAGLTADATLKYYLPFLARTDFVGLFGTLPANQQTALQQGGGAAVVAAVVHAANSNQLLSKPRNAGFWDTGFAANAPLVRLPAAGLGSLTIQDWLGGIVDPGNPVDYLNPTTMEAWLRARAVGADEAKRRASKLESFAVIGATSPSRHTEAPDIAGRSALAVFEHRLIMGTHRPADAALLAYNYLKFFVNLKSGLGEPGKYPEGFWTDLLASATAVKDSGADYAGTKLTELTTYLWSLVPSFRG